MLIRICLLVRLTHHDHRYPLPLLTSFRCAGRLHVSALPRHRSKDLIAYAAGLAAASFTTHAVVFAADECFQISPNCDPKLVPAPKPFIAFREDIVRPDELPLGARESEPAEGIEIHADRDRRRVWTAEYVEKRRRWRVLLFRIDKKGDQVRRREYEGNARGLYLYAEKIGANIDEMQEALPGLPTPWETYDQAVEDLIRGTRVRCDEGECCYWRDKRGWWLRVVGNGTGYQPLEPPLCEDYGPFRNQQVLRDAMAEKGVA